MVSGQMYPVRPRNMLRLAWVFLMFCTLQAAAAQTNLNVEVRLRMFDYYVYLGEEIHVSETERIRLDFEPPTRLSPQGVYETLIALNRFGAISTDTIVVFVRPDTYLERQVGVRLDLVYAQTEPSAAIDLRVHLVPRALKADPRLIDGFLRTLNWRDPVHRDAALALLEAQHVNVDLEFSLTVNEIRVLYNYARALYETCTKDGYDTCAEAKDAFTRMLQAYRSDAVSRANFESEGIFEPAFENALTQLEYKRVQRRYAAVEALASQESASQDARAARFCLLRDILESEFPEHADVWRDQGRPEVVMHADAGMAGLGFAERTIALARDTLTPDDLRSLLADVPCMSDYLARLGIDAPNTIAGRIATWVLEQTIHHYERSLHLFEASDIRLPGVYSRDVLASDLAHARSRLGQASE